MQPERSLADLMERLRHGDPDAANCIVETFYRRLIGLARSRMEGPLLRKEGPEDIVQSALKSFFRRQTARPFVVASWESLWGLLATFTLRKCSHHVEYYLAQCRDVRLEAQTPDTGSSTERFEAIARDPTPEEAAMLEDTLRELLKDLDPREQAVVRLTLEGHSVLQISKLVHRSEHLVRKTLERVKTRWQRLCKEGNQR